MSSYEHPKGRLVETIINGKKELSPDPSDNINRTWPGDPNGSEAAQVTYVFVNDFWEKIKPTHLIDLHCYNRFTIACTLAEENNKESIEFAKAAAFPLLRTTPKIQGKKDATTITRWARESGSEVVSFAAEFSGQYILIEKEVKRGVRMLSNCSKHIGIFEGKLEGMDDKPMIVKDDKTEVHYVKAPISGLFIENGLTNGGSIEEGDILGYLFSDETLETLEIKAPVSGYLYLYGSCRHLCDVDLAAMHPYSDKDGILTTIIREKSI